MQPQSAVRYNVTIVRIETYYFPRHPSHCRDWTLCRRAFPPRVTKEADCVSGNQNYGTCDHSCGIGEGCFGGTCRVGDMQGWRESCKSLWPRCNIFGLLARECPRLPQLSGEA